MSPGIGIGRQAHGHGKDGNEENGNEQTGDGEGDGCELGCAEFHCRSIQGGEYMRLTIATGE